MKGSIERLGFLLFLPFLANCGGGDEDGGSTPTGPDREFGIGQNGGAANLAGGSVLISVPVGALSSLVLFTASPVSTVQSAELFVTGSGYDVGPSGTTFATPAALSILYDPSGLPEGVLEDELGLFKAIGGVPQLMTNSTVNTAAHVVSGRITSLSTYGAWGLPVAT